MHLLEITHNRREIMRSNENKILEASLFCKGAAVSHGWRERERKRRKRFHKFNPGITPASRRLERLADVTLGMVRALPNAPSLDVLQTASGFYR